MANNLKDVPESTRTWLCKLASNTSYCKVNELLDKQFEVIRAKLETIYSQQTTKGRVALCLLLGSHINKIQSPLPILEENSGNCTFCIVTAKFNAGPTSNLFVKVVDIIPDDERDRLEIDNITGWYLNQLCEILPVLRKFLMQYVYSCQVYVKRLGSKTQTLTLDTDLDIQDPDSNFYQPPSRLTYAMTGVKHALHSATQNVSKRMKMVTSPIVKGIYSGGNSNYEVANISIFAAIDGKSFSKYAELWVAQIEKTFLRILPLIPEFIDAMLYTGTRFGMIHNDLHTGNLYYDSRTNTLRLIDYGRMYIAAANTNEMFDQLKRELQKQGRWTDGAYTSYDDFMEDQSSYLRTWRNKAGLYPSCIMDYITLSMNMLSDIDKGNPSIVNELQDFVQIRDLQNYKTTSFSFIGDVETIVRQFITFANNPNKPWLRYIGEGVFFFVLFLYYVTLIRPNISKHTYAHQSIDITLVNIKKSKFMHWYYQYSGSQVTYEGYVTWLEQLMTTNILPSSLVAQFNKVSIFMKILNGKHTSQFGGGKKTKTTSSTKFKDPRLGATSATVADMAYAYLHDHDPKTKIPFKPERSVFLEARKAMADITPAFIANAIEQHTNKLLEDKKTNANSKRHSISQRTLVSAYGGKKATKTKKNNNI